MNSASAWKLYHACFKEGEEVVIIDEDDNYFWGKLETHDDHCILRRSTLKPIKVMWENVVFMSHDGFPVARIRESSRAAAALDKIRIRDAAHKARRMLTATVCDRCEKATDTVLAQSKHSFFRDSKTGKTIQTLEGMDSWEGNVLCPKCRALCEPIIVRRGDPWEINCASARLFNPGNFGPDYWGEDDEEMIVATSGDGAFAHISAIDTIFNLEVA